MISELQIKLNPENLLSANCFNEALSSQRFKVISYTKLNRKFMIEKTQEYIKIMSWLGSANYNFETNKFRIYFEFDKENKTLYIGLYDINNQKIYSKMKICDSNGHSDEAYPFLNGKHTYEKFLKLFN